MFRIMAAIFVMLFAFVCSSASVLHEMIDIDDINGISRTLSTDAGLLEERNESMLSPLNHAVCNGKLDIVKLLIRKGADIHSGDREGSQPLINAAALGFMDITRYLVENGADIDRKDDNDNTALCFALMRRQFDIARYLMQQGADPRLTNMRNMPGLFFPVMSGNLEIVQMMVERGVNVDEPLESGVTPFVSACTRGNLEIAQYLVDNGANHDYVDNQGQTPLFWAAFRKQPEVITFLLSLGADVNRTDNDGETPLFKATGDLTTLKMLETAGGDIRKLNNTGSNLFINIAWNGSPEVITYLADFIDVNKFNDVGTSGFYFAVQNDSLELVQAFLDNGADPNFGCKDEWQGEIKKTSVHLAAVNGSLEMMNLLQKYGADINKEDLLRGRTPLHYAAVNGDEALIDHLLTSGAKLNVRDNLDFTVLDYARKYGYTELENKLNALGAKASEAHFELEELKAGECRSWYTGHSGWVIETMNQILVFDYWKRLEPADEASIKNGCLTHDFLDCDKQVSIFVSHVHTDHYDERIFEFADLDNVEYFFGFQPPREETLTVLTAREPVIRDNFEIYPIYSNDSGVGFLVEADGIVIFHPGDHANRERDLSGDYLPEIEYIAGLDKNIDLAFMPIRGCNFGDNEAVRIGVYKTLDILHPQYFIPMHSGSNESHYLDFNLALSEAGYDLNKFAAMDSGDRFTYHKR